MCEISSLASFGESLTVPELLVNLHYKDLTGRLTVEVIRGANLKREYMLLNPGTMFFRTRKKTFISYDPGKFFLIRNAHKRSVLTALWTVEYLIT